MNAPPPRSGPPEEGTPEYEWLYGSAEPSEGDETQVLPTSPQSQPDATRVLPTVDAAPPPKPAPRRGRGSGPSAPPPPPAPPRDAPKAQRRPRGRRPRFRLRWVLYLLVLWLIFLVAVPLWVWGKVDKVSADPGGDRPADQPGTNYLLVGSDSRADLTPEERQELGTGGDVGQRTDTIMLLHIGSGPNVLTSIPRDSIVDIPGHGESKVNAAFAYGGPELLVQTLENETGIRIDKYVEIGIGGFVQVVDAVGGITICPTQAMKDPLANLDIKKGCQEADGAVALGYARSRHTSGLGDIDRAKHQREVVSAVGSKAVSPWAVVNPLRYWNLNNAMPGLFKVSEDTGPFDMARFALAMRSLSGANGMTCGVPIADLSVRWDAERSEEFFGYLREDNTDALPRSLCTPSGMPR